MPEFNSDSALRIVSDDYVWDADLSYGTLVLSTPRSDASQLLVLFNVNQMYTGSNNTGAVVDVEGGSFSVNQITEIRTLPINNLDVENKTFRVSQPIQVNLSEPAIINGVEVSQLYYNTGAVVSSTQTLEVRRNTDVTEPVVDFQPGARLTSTALNAANNQNLFAIQELTEFGSFTQGSSGGGGGGGSFDGVLTDIPGATNLSSDGTGSVIWDSGAQQLRSTLDAQGVLPATDSFFGNGSLNNLVLKYDRTLTNETRTQWVNLSANEVESVPDLSFTLPGSLAEQIRNLEGQTEPINNALSVWSVDVGGNTIQLDARNIELNALDSVDVDGNVNVGTLGGSSILTLNGVNINNVISNAVLVTDDLDALANVSTADPDTGSYLQWNGTEWAPTGTLDVPSTVTLKYGGIIVGSSPQHTVENGTDYQLINSLVGLTGDAEINSLFDTTNKRWTSDFEGRIKIDASFMYSKKSGNGTQTNVNTSIRTFDSSGTPKPANSSYTAYGDASPDRFSGGQVQIDQTVYIDVEVGDYFEYYVNNAGDSSSNDILAQYWNLTVQKTTFDATIEVSGTTTPIMHYQGYLGNSDFNGTRQALYSNAVDADNGNWDFPVSYVPDASTFSGSSEFANNTDSNGVFTAPRNMTLRVAYNFNWAGNQTADIEATLTVNGNQWQMKRVHEKTAGLSVDIGASDFTTMSGEWVVDLETGDELKLSFTSGSMERCTYNVTEILNGFNATIVAENALKVITTDWSDRQNPLNETSNSLYEPTQVGLGADGRPIYEIYEEVALTSSISPGDTEVIYTGFNDNGTVPPTGARNFLVDAYNITSEFTGLTAVTDTDTTEYLGSNVTVMFGLYLTLRAADGNQIDLSRNNQGFGSGESLNSGTIIRIATRYQLSSDPLYQNYELVPVDNSNAGNQLP